MTSTAPLSPAERLREKPPIWCYEKMADLIERVARAICKASSTCDCELEQRDSNETCASAQDTAEAAIAAIGIPLDILAALADGTMVAFSARELGDAVQPYREFPSTKVQNTGNPWDIVKAGFDSWKRKPHNAKWVRKIDGTPIENDLTVNIVEAMRAAAAGNTDDLLIENGERFLDAMAGETGNNNG